MTPKNKFGIDDAAELARVEERISKRNALALFTSGRLDNLPAGKFLTLAEIHRAMFGEIYDFAGKLRTVNLAKGHFRFAAALYLAEAVAHIENMPQKNFNAIVDGFGSTTFLRPNLNASLIGAASIKRNIFRLWNSARFTTSRLKNF